MMAPARLAARLLAGALALVLPALALAQEPTPAPNPWKLAYARRMAEEGMERRRTRAERQRELRLRARELRAGLAGRKAGERLRPARPEAELPVPEPGRPTRAARGFGALAFTTPANARVNDPGNEPLNETQSETSIVAFGDRMVAAWNDGAGFPTDTQGWGTSIDGGLTWTDRGVFPHAPGRANFEWASDPVLTINEKTGAIYFTALCDFTIGPVLYSGVGIVKGRWNGTTFAWGVPAVADSMSENAGYSLDKEWAVADSSNGRVYLTHTRFFNGADARIFFQFSDSNAAVWSVARQLSVNVATENGWVQASRPVVNGDGKLYVMYYLIGQGFSDFYRVLTSTDGGVTFQGPVTAESLYTNFGTGCPGFNRPFGVQFAGLSVDRSHGPYRGRVYLSWAESINWLDDVFTLGQVDARSEVENNNSVITATPAIVGSTLRGSITVGDVDFWSVPLAAGEHVIVASDSVSAGCELSLRLFDTNGTSALTFTTFDATVNPSAQAPQGSPSGWMFTAPTSGTYFVRVAPRTGTGSYRVRIGDATRGTERGRDQRDVFVGWSDDGFTWAEPSRLSEDPVGYDAFLPEVAVAPDGGVYAAWYDFHDAVATDGAASSTYLARSGDGGATWTTLGAVTDTSSNWSSVSSSLEPNLGDYISLFTSSSYVWPCWADVRRGGPDVFAAQVPLIPNGPQVSVRSVRLAFGRVSMEWAAVPADTLTMRLYRSVDGGAYQYLALVQFDAAGALAYTDSSLAGDHAYAYRLGRFSNSIELFSGQVRVFLPSTFPLSISPPRPNPVTGNSFVADFSLATNAPADLILFDIAGREVFRQRLAPGMGPRTVGVPVNHDLHQGFYVLTVRQGGHNASTRIQLMR